MRDLSDYLALHRANVTLQTMSVDGLPLRLFEMAQTIERAINA